MVLDNILASVKAHKGEALLAAALLLLLWEGLRALLGMRSGFRNVGQTPGFLSRFQVEQEGPIGTPPKWTALEVDQRIYNPAAHSRQGFIGDYGGKGSREVAPPDGFTGHPEPPIYYPSINYTPKNIYDASGKVMALEAQRNAELAPLVSALSKAGGNEANGLKAQINAVNAKYNRLMSGSGLSEGMKNNKTSEQSLENYLRTGRM